MDEYQVGSLRYATCSSLAIGDYSGSGAVGESNQRVIDEAAEAEECTVDTVEDIHKMALATERSPEDPTADYNWPTYYVNRGWEGHEMPIADVLVETGAFGHRAYYVRCDDNASAWCRDIVAALASYPLLSEDVYSETEADRQNEALNNWARHDVLASLPDDDIPGFGVSMRDLADDIGDAIVDDAIAMAMEETNTYWNDEQDGMSLDVARIAPVMAERLRDACEQDRSNGPASLRYAAAWYANRHWTTDLPDTPAVAVLRDRMAIAESVIPSDYGDVLIIAEETADGVILSLCADILDAHPVPSIAVDRFGRTDTETAHLA